MTVVKFGMNERCHSDTKLVKVDTKRTGYKDDHNQNNTE